MVCLKSSIAQDKFDKLMIRKSYCKKSHGPRAKFSVSVSFGMERKRYIYVDIVHGFAVAADDPADNVQLPQC